MITSNDKFPNRIWELDFLRGIALILMIYFHILFDMENIYGFHIITESGINYYIGKFSAILFILLSGISSILSRNNTKRALKLLLFAIIITIVTQHYNPALNIKFGILHFLGICILLTSIFKNLNKYFLLVYGCMLILFGSFVTSISAPNDYFFFLGITSKNFSSSDYYPLIPWLGIFLFGIALGNTFYSTRRSVFRCSLKDNFLSIAGRHTLLLYIIHQPVIIGIFFFFS